MMSVNRTVSLFQAPGRNPMIFGVFEDKTVPACVYKIEGLDRLREDGVRGNHK